MSNTTREILGFLSRWSLLALAGATVLASIYEGLVAAANISAGLNANLVMPDGISQPGMDRVAVLRGYVPAGALAGRAPMLMVRRDGQPPILAASRKDMVRAPIRSIDPGINRVFLQGLPYGSLALEGYEAIVLGAATERDLFLLDVRMLNDPSPAHTATVRDCLERLRALGSVGFFHSGPLEQFPRLRKQARQADAQTPVAFLKGDASDLTETLRSVAWTWSRRKRRPVVVTADGRLASKAAAEGFAVHLIGPAEIDRGHARTIQRHQSLAKFKEYLPVKPISEQ